MNGKTFSFVIVGILAVIILATYFGKNAPYNAGDLKKFDSYSDLKSYIEDSQSASNNYATVGGGGRFADSGAPATWESAVAGAVGGSSSGGGIDYSRTNVQVAGVDELDIVKNDDKYIYTVNQNKVVIVEAYPADTMKIVSEIEFDNYVNGIFVENDKLIVIESSYDYYYYGFAGSRDGVMIESATTADDVSINVQSFDSGKLVEGISPPFSSKAEVRVHVYEVGSDMTKPNLIETFIVDGNYYSARLINGIVYVIGSKYIDSSNIIIPFFKAGGKTEKVDASSVYYPGIFESNLIFTSVMAIDIQDLEYEGNVFLLGGSSVIYVSENAIYLTSQKSYDYIRANADSLKVIADTLPRDFGSRARDVIDSNDEHYLKYDKINQIMQEYFNKLSTTEKKKFEDDFANANKNYYAELSKEYEKTVIHRIDINKLDISYAGSGEVPGYILNQFSMDEFEGNIRIATTTGNSFGNFGESLNHVYVLNDKLKIIGSVENLAHGERIYSARFLGDKVYMVTFRQVDPLYVIDLSSVRNPKVLGYLKVTGFSNYLHPIGKNLLLGIGHEATDEGRAQGLKVSLFDVSDFENPKELSKYIVENQWSYSEAEYEHKAVLFDDKRDLLVIPVTYSSSFGNNWEYWQGAFVFTVTDRDISLKGKIAHDIKNENNGIQNYYSNNYGYVSRSLFIDDALYTMSSQMIKANALPDLTEVSYVELPFDEYYPIAY